MHGVVNCRWKVVSSVIALHTSVGPIDSSIFSCGHFTTVVNGNIYSFLAMACSANRCDHGRTQIGTAIFLDQPWTEVPVKCLPPDSFRSASIAFHTPAPAPGR